MTAPSALQAQRLAHANALLQLISAHGRRFFYNAQFDRVAQFEFTESGRLIFRDDYTHQAVTVPKEEGGWKGFSHGSTLRHLVNEIATYIRSGAPVHPGYIAPKRPEGSLDDNVWGYAADAAATLREQAQVLPIFAPKAPTRARRARP